MTTTPITGPTWESDQRQVPEMPGDCGHSPVLYQQVVKWLSVRPGGCFLDGTVGAGGHAAAILEASSPDGRLLGMDRDPAAIAAAGRRLAQFGDRVTLVHASYARMRERAAQLGFEQLDSIVLDLGLSSCQLQDPARGFAFRHDGPLDMRFDPREELTAATLVNELASEELANVLFRYGEERDSRRVARAIVAARPLRTTRELAAVVSSALVHRERSLHPATRTFQALRIAVNRELDHLSDALPEAVRLLRPGGRLAVIAFHSLEDRLVKQFFRQEAQDCLCPRDLPVCTCGHRAVLRIVTRKPIRPGPGELEQNPRSRSARLRVAERIMSASAANDRGA